MKKYLPIVLIVLISAVFLVGAKGSSYEPEQLKSEINQPVMLYIEGVDVGFTAIKVNDFQNFLIKSTNQKEIKLLSFDGLYLMEAWDENGNVLAYKLTKFSLLEAGFTNPNEELKDGESTLNEFMESIDEKDLSQNESDNPDNPDPAIIKKSRQVFVINLVVENSEGKQNKLQIFVESFSDK